MAGLCLEFEPTAGWSGASIAGLLGLGVSPLSQIIGAGMNHDSSLCKSQPDCSNVRIHSI